MLTVNLFLSYLYLLFINHRSTIRFATLRLAKWQFESIVTIYRVTFQLDDIHSTRAGNIVTWP